MGGIQEGVFVRLLEEMRVEPWGLPRLQCRSRSLH